MSNEPRLREEALFETLLALKPGQRAAFLREACGPDAELLRNVEALLKAHEQEDGVLEERAQLARGAGDFSPQHKEHLGDRIGRYKLLQQLGEGGCGVVYLAEQKEPVRRRVALKVIKLGMDTKQVIARFEAERQALALMDHPNIARVLDAGATDTGRPYFAMELVRGIKITEFCDAHQLSVRDRLQLFIQVCQAVQHAHQKGVIHRDLKPSNILVAMSESVAVPKVIDFGIAKAIEGKLTDLTLFTAFEQFIGTPAYMSPEQASLTALDVDTRSDIYSLGVLLYELLTGSTPFETKALLSSGLDGLRRTIREKEPPRPSTRLNGLPQDGLANTALRRSTDTTRLVRQLKGDIDWIVMKCLEKDRSRRYETANGLVREVQRYLANEPVVACPPSQWYRLQKLVRRNKLAVAAVAAVTVSLVGGLALSTWLFTREKRAHARTIEAQDMAEREHRRADLHRAHAERLLARERVKDGWSDWDRGDYWAARSAFLDALRLEKDEPERASVHRLRLAAIEPLRPPLQRVWFAGGHLSCAALSPDGEVLAVAFTGGPDGPAARLFQRSTGEPRGLAMRHSGRINSLEFSHDGRFLLTASADHTTRVWDTAQGKPLTDALAQPAPVQVARFNSKATRIIMGSWDPASFASGYVTVWDLQDKDTIFTTSARGLNVRTVLFSPDDRVAVFGCESFVGEMIDLNSGEAEPLPNCWCMLAGTFSSDGQKLLIGGSFGPDGRANGARLWDLARTNWSAPLMSQDASVLCATFSSDGRQVATGGNDRTARVWGFVNGLPVSSPLPHLGAVLSVAFSHDGRSLLTTSADQTARVWDVSSSQPLNLPLPHAGAVLLARFSADDKTIWTIASDGAVCTWSAERNLRPRLQLPHDTEVYRVVPGNRQQLTTGDRNHLHIWNSANGQALAQSPDLPEDWRWHLSPDAKYAIVNYGSNLSVWNSEAGTYTLGDTNRSHRLASAQFFRDGRRAIVLPSQSDGVLEINSQDGRATRRFTADIELLAAALAPDERQVLAVGRQGQMRIWDARTTQPLRSALYSGLDVPKAIEFSPDGKWLLMLGTEDNLGLWNAETLEPVAAAFSSVQGVTCAQFSPDSRWLAVGHRDGLVAIHNATNGLVQFAPVRHSALIFQIAFSGDGRLFATGSRDNTARVWELATGEPVTPPLPHLASVFDVAFTKDPFGLCTASADRMGRVWEFPLGPSVSSLLEARPSVSTEPTLLVRRWDPAAAFTQSLDALSGKPDVGQ